jgi:Holliday junction DNA helicase RuvA
VIDRLSGKLAACDLTEVVVDVHGVGYAVTVPLSTYDRLPRAGDAVELYTHLHVRDDALQLFGFADPQERRLFRLLITVSGIGPRLALKVLSCMSVPSFCAAVLDGDVKALTRVNGLGKRSAERLVVELREVISEVEPAAAFGAGREEPPVSQQVQDAVAALATLGFRPEAARKTVQKLCTELPAAEQSAENLIRCALQALNS